jgi:hypothetical protein
LCPIKPARFEQPPFSQRRATARIVTAPFARGRRDRMPAAVLNFAEADIVPIGLYRLRRSQRRTARLIRRYLVREGNWCRLETSQTPGIYPEDTLLTHARRLACGSSFMPSRVISERSPRPATLEPIKDWSLTSLEKPTKIGAKGASRDCDVLSKWPTSPPPRNLFPTSSVCLELRPRTGRVNSITKCSLSRVPRLDDGRFSIPAARPRVGRALQTWGENPNFRFAFNPDGAKEFHVDGEDPAGKVFSGVWPATFNGA